MLIRPMSDLHLEFGDFDIPTLPGDEKTVLVLAGDVHVGTNARNWIEKAAAQFRAVVYVLGNHEFYHGDVTRIEQTWQMLELPENVHVLINDCVSIDGVKFIGSTLWSDFNGLDWFEIQAAKNNINDFQVIANKGVRWTPEMAHDRCKLNEYFIREALATANGRTVVVTHHLPDRSLISPKYALARTNGAYAARLRDLIYEPDLWIFGHTHESLYLETPNNTIVCNPRGYEGHEINPSFNSRLLVSV